MILGVRKKKNDFLFSLRYICLLPCGVPQKTRNGYCKLKSLACLHMGIAEETSRIRSGSSWWKYVGRKSGHTGTKGKTHAACTRPGFHAKFSYFPVTSYLFHLPFFISGEYGNLKTLARRRKQYHKCSPSLHPTFIDTDILYKEIYIFKKTHCGSFWLICIMICTWFWCFILLKPMILKYLTVHLSIFLFVGCYVLKHVLITVW